MKFCVESNNVYNEDVVFSQQALGYPRSKTLCSDWGLLSLEAMKNYKNYTIPRVISHFPFHNLIFFRLKFPDFSVTVSDFWVQTATCLLWK